MGILLLAYRVFLISVYALHVADSAHLLKISLERTNNGKNGLFMILPLKNRKKV